MKKFFLQLLVAVLICACSKKVETQTETISVRDSVKFVAEVKGSTSFINPPLKNLNIPYQEFSVAAQKVKTVKFPSGSRIDFPPNAFVDSKGNVIKGEVTVVFREFIDPVDFFISGIPMNYDEANATHVFESAAMCEIKAFHKGEAVYVNSQAQPLVSLRAKKDQSDNKTYFLDMIQKKWIAKSKSQFSKARPEPVIEADTDEYAVDDEKVRLAEPLKASGKMPVFSVNVEFVTKPELKIYTNTEFEVDESEKNYDPAQADKDWDNVRIADTDTEGLYLITFYSATKNVSYRVRPVYRGGNYVQAMKTYKAEQRKYEMETKAKQTQAEKKAEILNYFKIDQFGIWNCDRIFDARTQKIEALFADVNNKPMDLKAFYLVNFDRNALFSFADRHISIVPNAASAIWTMQDGKFLYCSVESFSKSEKSGSEPKRVFKIKTLNDSITDSVQLKKLLGYKGT